MALHDEFRRFFPDPALGKTANETAPHQFLVPHSFPLSLRNGLSRSFIAQFDRSPTRLIKVQTVPQLFSRL